MNKKTLSFFFFIIVFIFLSFAFYIAYSWINPNQSPPSGGGVLQTDSSGLRIVTSTYFTSGNVGIGITNPGAKLEVRTSNTSSVGISSSDDGGSRLLIVPKLGQGSYTSLSSSGDIGIIYYGSSGQNSGGLVIGQWSTSPRGIKIDINGNVGIGVTNPVSLLELYKNNENPTLTITSATSTTYSPQIAFRTGVIPSIKYTVGVNISDSKLRLIPGSDITTSTGITIDSTGRVGIRTTNLASDFHILSNRTTIENSGAGLLSVLNMWNSNTSTNAGTGMLFSAGDISTNFIGGFGSQKIDANNSRTFARVLSNGTLTGSDSNGPFYLEGSSSGVKVIMNGNVGISTTSPSEKLDVAGNIKGFDIKGNRLCIGTDCRNSWPSGGGSTTTASGTVNYVAKFTSTSTIGNSRIYDDGSRVGIGTSNPYYTLDVNGDIKGSKLCILDDCRDKWYWEIYHPGISGLPDVLRVNSSTGIGIVHLPLTSVDELIVSEHVRIEGFDSGNNNSLLADGDIQTLTCLEYPGGSLGTCSSDIRLKRNIQPFEIDNALAKLINLKPVKYQLKDDDIVYTGLIADEVEKFAPEFVIIDENGYKRIKYGDIQWLTIKAIQEQQKQIEELKTENNYLKERIKILEEKLGK